MRIVLIGLFFIDTSRFTFVPRRVIRRFLPRYRSQYTRLSGSRSASFRGRGALTAAGFSICSFRGPRRRYGHLDILAQTVAIGTLPQLASSERPLADAAVNFIGPMGCRSSPSAAIISIFGNLNVGLLAGSRLLYAMGERNELPAIFASTHQRFRTPVASLIVKTVFIFVLTVQSSFISAVAIATITRLLVYATTCLALPIFRSRGDVPEARFKAPLGMAAAVLSMVLIAWLLTSVDFAKEGISLAVWLFIGLVIFVLMKLFGRGRSTGELREDTLA